MTGFFEGKYGRDFKDIKTVFGIALTVNALDGKKKKKNVSNFEILCEFCD